MKNLNWMAVLAVVLASCSSSSNQSGQEEETDQRTEIRLIQYKVQGKKLYQTYCSNCHQEDGQGLARLYPPLAGSDYLLADLPRAACLIKKGMNETIKVNGVEFNQMMPANEGLTPIQVAEILTYISNSWGNEAGITATIDVTQWLNKCE